MAKEERNIVDAQLHQLLMALYNTLKDANQLMEDSDSRFRYTLDEVDVDLPIKVDLTENGQTKGTKGSKTKELGLQIEMPDSKAAKDIPLSDKLKNKEHDSIGRIRVKFSRDLIS